MVDVLGKGEMILPMVLAGPVLRHISSDELTFWLVTSCSAKFELSLYDESDQCFDTLQLDGYQQEIQVGEHCFIQLIHYSPSKPLEQDVLIQYQLKVNGEEITKLIPELCYLDQEKPGFMIKSRADNILHGSCRKPHHASEDGLLAADQVLSKAHLDVVSRPALMIFSGDQIYADDVAGPTLVAIHQLIGRLGLFDEIIENELVPDSQKLIANADTYYGRKKLLPNCQFTSFNIKGEQPIFSSDSAENHLISLSEMLAMYLLVWSPSCWQLVDCELGLARIPKEHQDTYLSQFKTLKEFVLGLTKVQRLMAHLPVYMIFDDHDVTDDWNLTRAWEEAIYSNPLGRRVIGNSLIAYWLCQGWGNQPNRFEELQNDASLYFGQDGFSQQDELVDRILDWNKWHYSLATSPKILVLDTRTQRWRSESKANKPSGLMDWETLIEMQQELINEPEVILVSPAPVFGVKLIEVIQKIFTFVGRPLMVDAENWMAHPGSANVMLNIFRHKKTPPNFIILSGDVHYSFVYQIKIRFRKHGPQILQVTTSGIKNNFPAKLLNCFDTLNRVLFSSASPLNLLTQRRRMSVRWRKPETGCKGVLYNQSGIGQLILDEEFEKTKALVISRERATEFK
ncbi:MAG: alkaline phosphatase D family protein [Marinomonas sp.]